MSTPALPVINTNQLADPVIRRNFQNLLEYISGLPTTAVAGNNYYSGSSSGCVWTTTSHTLADPTYTGTNALTKRQGNITVTTAASNLPGITFTPAASTSIYQISVSFAGGNDSEVYDNSYFSLTDGTTIITTSAVEGPGGLGGAYWITMSSIYAPGTGSAVTVKIQAAAPAGTAAIGFSNSTTTQLEWSIVQLV